ncbi:hypothetical protein GKQ23_20720 [Erwinia sp. E602]|uniref:hypothetical protein n=1 Tax=Erwinia sp. E602 TaxID=2675378 RepID=UPI001BAA4299|nr:hypothetical protein [Erwinia sp. E602]QUG77269.1 hypothetical protein GKQ23_20720 [Erwinia sp. E602]
MSVGRYVTLIRYSLRLLLRPHPRLSSLFIVLIVLQGIIPSASVIASIRLGDLVGHGTHNQLLTACLIWAFTLVLPEMIAPLLSTLQSVLNQKATQLTQHKIMSAVAHIDDLQTIEGPELHDSLQMLSKEAAYRPLNLLVNLVDICRSSFTLLSLALVLASVAWWLPLALLLPAIPVAASVARSQLDVFRALLGNGKTARLIGYYFSVIVDVKLAREIKLFGLADFFIARHRAAFAEMDGILKKTRRNQFLRPQKWNLLYLISAMGIMLWFSDYLASGKISTGELLGTLHSLSPVRLPAIL